MRVSFPHLGHAVDFVVSMTFFRSAVFAIFAIQSLLTGMCRQPKSIARGSTWSLGSIVVGRPLLDDKRTPAHLESACQNQSARKRCTILASRILHELQHQGRTEGFAKQLDFVLAFGWRSGSPLR